MTIKQHGGIFGRNPTFNDVTAESLTVAGNALPDASTILVDGDIGSTVQGYDADTAKLDVAQTFTAAQTFNESIIMANTKGIDFSATSDSAGTTSSELFVDYEEGEWTPRLYFGGGDETGFAYTVQIGRYTKVGNLVNAFARIVLSSKGSASGTCGFIGLPFTSVNVTNFKTGAAPTNRTLLSEGSFNFNENTTFTGSSYQDTDISNTTAFSLNFIYQAA